MAQQFHFYTAIFPGQKKCSLKRMYIHPSLLQSLNTVAKIQNQPICAMTNEWAMKMWSWTQWNKHFIAVRNDEIM